MNRRFVFVLTLTLLVGTLDMPSIVYKAKAWTGTIYIRADGSIDPPTAPISTVDNVTYVLTGNITSDTVGIVVERDNVVVDGTGCIVQGKMASNSMGIDLEGSNVTIKNMNIKAFDNGIYLHSSNSSVSGNNITNSYWGIWLNSSSSNSIGGNNIDRSVGRGINLIYSLGNSISGNNITRSGYGIYLDYSYFNSISGNTFFYDGLYVEDSYWNVVVDNLVNGKPLVYLEGVSDEAVEDAGQVILVNCNRIRVENLNLSHTTSGVQLWQTNNTKISQNNIINNNVYGICLDSSSNNSISGNNITNNGHGIYLSSSANNTFCHNGFINNRASQVYIFYSSTNVWDDGYPSGGNYWSGYKGADMLSGTYQNETGGDGVGDTSYIIDSNNADHYPLMGLFNSYNVTYFTPPLVSRACNVTVISNSTISDFVAAIWIEHPEVIFLEFYVTGEQSSTGFCRVSFPTAMMNGTYHVSVNGTEVPYDLLPCSNSTYSYLYFTYHHSTQQVVIIAEFPSFLILPISFVATLLAVIVYKRTRIWKNLQVKS